MQLLVLLIVAEDGGSCGGEQCVSLSRRLPLSRLCFNERRLTRPLSNPAIASERVDSERGGARGCPLLPPNRGASSCGQGTPCPYKMKIL